ncbi:hypothetical protein EVAR_94780_1 [Eumeta japonica]|uniref:Uncharacterized protein n=1 Tax=Eumeta variegata TaxID=151549 RepID=A0A4C1UH10_EUMVA|nr:hypothetical protein EVAR_94780_1 [Eumeta japonica]
MRISGSAENNTIPMLSKYDKGNEATIASRKWRGMIRIRVNVGKERRGSGGGYGGEVPMRAGGGGAAGRSHRTRALRNSLRRKVPPAAPPPPRRILRERSSQICLAILTLRLRLRLFIWPTPREGRSLRLINDKDTNANDTSRLRRWAHEIT